LQQKIINIIKKQQYFTEVLQLFLSKIHSIKRWQYQKLRINIIKMGGVHMDRKIREGLVPTVLGAAVTAAGLAAYGAFPVTAAGITGFGLAHIVLGGIDLVTHKDK